MQNCKFYLYGRVSDRSSMTTQILIILFCIFGVATCGHLRCGSALPRHYNPETHDCKNGIVRRKVTTKPTKRSCDSTVTPTPEQISDHKPRPTSKADILDCKLSLQRGKTKGRQCCGGFDTYNPRFETCCQRGLKSAVRHRNKKEREHACCTEPPYDLNEVYTRGSKEIPCKHPSLNDKLFRGQHLNGFTRHCKSYMDYNFAYIIRIHKKTRLQFSECYNASITKLTWKRKWVKETIYNKLIPIDNYTPKVKRIHKKVFIVLSNCNQSQNLDFYLDKEDVVFKIARARKKFTEIFNWVWKKCRRKVARSRSRIFY